MAGCEKHFAPLPDEIRPHLIGVVMCEPHIGGVFHVLAEMLVQAPQYFAIAGHVDDDRGNGGVDFLKVAIGEHLLVKFQPLHSLLVAR